EIFADRKAIVRSEDEEHKTATDAVPSSSVNLIGFEIEAPIQANNVFQAAVLGGDTPMNSENVHELLDNIVRLHDQASETSDEEFLDFQTILVSKLTDAGNYTLAIKVLGIVVETQSKVQGSNHLETITAKRNLASLLENQGQYTHAQELYNELLQIQIDVHGPDHPETILTKYCLAVAFHNQ
ncbi:unnamed protein product, partial [Allacma fusca]